MKQPKHKTVIERARSFTVFIYSYHCTLVMICKYTRMWDLVRASVTRLATIIFSLGALLTRRLFWRPWYHWRKRKNLQWSKTTKGKVLKSTIYSQVFLKRNSPFCKDLHYSLQNAKDSRCNQGTIYGLCLQHAWECWDWCL